MRLSGILFVCLFAGLLPCSETRAQGAEHASPPLAVGAATDTTNAVRLDMLNVRDADLRDVLRGIAHQYGLNLVVDNRIDRRVTIRLADLPVLEAIEFLARENGLRLVRAGQILRVEVPPVPPPARPPPPRIAVQNDRLTADLDGEDLETTLRLLAQQSGKNVLVRPGLRGTLSGSLRDVPFEAGLRTLLANNGFSLREKDGIYHVDRSGTDSPEGGGSRGLWVQVDSGAVELDVTGAKIGDVLREVAAQCGVNMVTYEVPDGTITARIEGLPFEAVLNFLFKGTEVTYRKDGEIYYIGNKRTSGIATTRLIRLDHIRADAVLELIPESYKESATLQIVREHNGLMVTGTNDVIVELESFIREIDFPTPQILIEALVVDFEAKDLFELGMKFGLGQAAPAAEADATPAPQDPNVYTFDGNGGAGPGFSIRGDGDRANKYLEGLSSLTSFFGVRNLGRLPADFFFEIHALAREGKANVRSRPQIATLNGHPASITIGTTQYYILKTNTPYQSPNQFYLQQFERFEKIEANVKLEVVPWVSASGQVTTEIRPEFSTPVGELNPEVPPTINTRVLDSTVRLRDGETIILGGLIQEIEAVTYDKVPFFGDIPLLGRLFRGQSREKKKAELVIFLTPHVFYGDERDDAKWKALQEQLDLSSMGPRRELGYTKLK